jgi:hypothetical protein
MKVDGTCLELWPKVGWLLGDQVPRQSALANRGPGYKGGVVTPGTLVPVHQHDCIGWRIDIEADDVEQLVDELRSCCYLA